jgi:transcriptional regulator with XRE-family HTH domain
MKGLTLKFQRLRRDLTQWELAVRAGIPPYRISDFERGRVEPRPDEAARLRAALSSTRAGA